MKETILTLLYIFCEGKQELSDRAGGCYSFQNVTDKEYTVGIHEVDESTDIKAFVYDGKDTELTR